MLTLSTLLSFLNASFFAPISSMFGALVPSRFSSLLAAKLSEPTLPESANGANANLVYKGDTADGVLLRPFTNMALARSPTDVNEPTPQAYLIACAIVLMISRCIWETYGRCNKRSGKHRTQLHSLHHEADTDSQAATGRPCSFASLSIGLLKKDDSSVSMIKSLVGYRWSVGHGAQSSQAHLEECNKSVEPVGAASQASALTLRLLAAELTVSQYLDAFYPTTVGDDWLDSRWLYDRLSAVSTAPRAEIEGRINAEIDNYLHAAAPEFERTMRTILRTLLLVKNNSEQERAVNMVFHLYLDQFKLRLSDTILLLSDARRNVIVMLQDYIVYGRQHDLKLQDFKLCLRAFYSASVCEEAETREAACRAACSTVAALDPSMLASTLGAVFKALPAALLAQTMPLAMKCLQVYVCANEHKVVASDTVVAQICDQFAHILRCFHAVCALSADDCLNAITDCYVVIVAMLGRAQERIAREQSGHIAVLRRSLRSLTENDEFAAIT